MTNPTQRSYALYQQAVKIMPGGVSSPVRAFGAVQATPIYYQKAKGSRFIDVDGNSYIDFCMSWGPLILGHSHPKVVEAVQQAAAQGLTYGACCQNEITLAQHLLEAFDAMDQVRFVSSGTEAVMTALRLARGVTQRSKIIKFEGGYHGHSDSLLVKAGSGLATLGTSSSAGVPSGFAQETIVCPFDDEQALQNAFSAHADSIAAVVVEPLPANNGLLKQRPAWLQKLRQLCDQHASLLILDEVISGFRTQWGGFGQAAGIRADLVTLGKIIGGGMPVGAIMGPKEIMQHLAPVGDVYQAGTLSGNPVSLAAGIATMKLLNTGVYEQLEELGKKLDQALKQAQNDLPFLNWLRVGSIVWFHLAPGDMPTQASAIQQESLERFNPMHQRLLQAGIYLPPSAYEVLFLSTAHTEQDVYQLVEQLTQALKA